VDSQHGSRALDTAKNQGIICGCVCHGSGLPGVKTGGFLNVTRSRISGKDGRKVNRFIGLLALCCAVVITLGTVPGCPKKTTGKTDTKTETTTVTVVTTEKEKDTKDKDTKMADTKATSTGETKITETKSTETKTETKEGKKTDTK
jgi:hypothetical protein